MSATLPPSDRAVPHFSQKAASGSFTVLQAGQDFFPSSRAPHTGQNSASSSTAFPHLGQRLSSGVPQRMQKFAVSLFS